MTTATGALKGASASSEIERTEEGTTKKVKDKSQKLYKKVVHSINHLRLKITRSFSPNFNKCHGKVNESKLNSSDLTSTFLVKPRLSKIQLHIPVVLETGAGNMVSSIRLSISALLIALFCQLGQIKSTT